MTAAPKKSRAEIHQDYKGFVEKFKPKKTTDDCLTPEPVYRAILQWVRQEYHIDHGRPIVRPFWPGADFERATYPPCCVVVDNPPFSILSHIVQWLSARGIAFFLFAPQLTLLSSKRTASKCTAILTDTSITYENGAIVKTAFLTNLSPDIALRTAPDLAKLIQAADEQAKPPRRALKGTPPSYDYPPEVVSAARIGSIAPFVPLSIPHRNCIFIGRLEAQRAHKKAIYGGGFLLSPSAAQRVQRARKQAEEARKQAPPIVWELSPTERAISQALDSEQHTTQQEEETPMSILPQNPETQDPTSAQK